MRQPMTSMASDWAPITGAMRDAGDARGLEQTTMLVVEADPMFRETLVVQHVWGYAFGGDMRTVDVHIRWLREKVEANPADPRLIQTVHGVDYRFRES